MCNAVCASIGETGRTLALEIMVGKVPRFQLCSQLIIALDVSLDECIYNNKINMFIEMAQKY